LESLKGNFLFIFSRQKTQNFAAAVDDENSVPAGVAFFSRNPFQIVMINQKFSETKTLADVSGVIIDFVNDALLIVMAKQAAIAGKSHSGSFAKLFAEHLLFGFVAGEIIPFDRRQIIGSGGKERQKKEQRCHDDFLSTLILHIQIAKPRFSLIPLAETVPHAGQKIFFTIKWVELNSA
jgi:hypothetical protein